MRVTREKFQVCSTMDSLNFQFVIWCVTSCIIRVPPWWIENDIRTRLKYATFAEGGPVRLSFLDRFNYIRILVLIRVPPWRIENDILSLGDAILFCQYIFVEKHEEEEHVRMGKLRCFFLTNRRTAPIISPLVNSTRMIE